MAAEQFRIHEDMIFRLSQRRSPSEVKLRSMEWAIVTQLNGEKTVGEIGEQLSLEPTETIAMFNRLMGEGLLELVGLPEKDPFVPVASLDEIEYEYTVFVGPVANIIMNDTLGELRRSRQNLERKQVALLIELLSLEISSDDKRRDFQRLMLNKIKGLV